MRNSLPGGRTEPQRAAGALVNCISASHHGGNTPVPDNDTLSGVAVALVLMLIRADLLVATRGVNVTLIVQ